MSKRAFDKIAEGLRDVAAGAWQDKTPEAQWGREIIKRESASAFEAWWLGRETLSIMTGRDKRVAREAFLAALAKREGK